MRNAEIGLRCAGAALLLALAPAAAMAYIDPGNGAYMVQALFTVAAAALFYLRHPVSSAKALWRWFVSRKDRASDLDSPSESLEESSTHSSTVRENP